MVPSLRLILMVMAAAPLFIAGSGVVSEVFVGIGVIYVIILIIYTAFDALVLPRRGKIEVKRLVPERISLGYPTRIVFEIQNHSRRRVEIRLAEEAPAMIDVVPAHCVATIGPQERKTVDYKLTAKQRGRHRLSNVFVRVLPEMGLLYRQFKLSIPAELKVFPNLIDMRRYELLTRRGLTYEEGLARLKRIGQGSEFESLRYYVRGDEISHIEWKVTAKRGKLITKNYEPEKQQNILVAIDVGRATAGQFGGLSRVDYLVNATLMLAYVALRQKDWFSVVAFSDQIESYLPPINGLKNIDRVARALFELQPHLVESDYGAACHFLDLKNRKRSLLCLMTDIVDRDTNNVIIDCMARFARYHLPLVVTLSNPEVHRVAYEMLSNCPNPYSKAVALDVLNSREEALVSMRRQGIAVLDVPPNRLTPELISRYTMIKSMHKL
ncbi:MAG: DUF58 domain-containing protein [Phycisphaerae bacterium]|nr:DUF58 domain-containing protein [candidate division Zixibacteria bacterium]NIV02993.1 DUF58 domain-containing protein [Phycisphaerae bacterium]NIX00389.1 DUF58 domain-containing protein [Phycisphaerae bacterium]